MLTFQDYLLSIVVVALIVCITTKFLKPTSKYRSLIQMIGGVVLLLTVASPVSRIKIDDYLDLYSDISAEAQSQVNYGVNATNNAMRQVIKEQTETYILEKAATLGAELQAVVTLDSGDKPYPVAIEISGKISPYAKKQLRQIICKDIGIPEESQTWT